MFEVITSQVQTGKWADLAHLFKSVQGGEVPSNQRTIAEHLTPAFDSLLRGLRDVSLGSALLAVPPKNRAGFATAVAHCARTVLPHTPQGRDALALARASAIATNAAHALRACPAMTAAELKDYQREIHPDEADAFSEMSTSLAEGGVDLAAFSRSTEMTIKNATASYGSFQHKRLLEDGYVPYQQDRNIKSGPVRLVRELRATVWPKLDMFDLATAGTQKIADAAERELRALKSSSGQPASHPSTDGLDAKYSTDGSASTSAASGTDSTLNTSSSASAQLAVTAAATGHTASSPSLVHSAALADTTATASGSPVSTAAALMFPQFEAVLTGDYEHGLFGPPAQVDSSTLKATALPPIPTAPTPALSSSSASATITAPAPSSSTPSPAITAPANFQLQHAGFGGTLLSPPMPPSLMVPTVLTAPAAQDVAPPAPSSSSVLTSTAASSSSIDISSLPSMEFSQ